MRLPMKNITQPLVIAPTLANLQMLASLDPDRRFSSANFLSDWVRPGTSHDDHDASRRFCIAAADSAFDVDARAGFAKLSTFASSGLRALLKVRSEWSHIIGDASTGPARRRNRRTLF
jgi:hypothetical protein